MPRVHKVNKARKDYSKFGIKKGDIYYWWKFRYGPQVKSLTYPKSSQLTQSSFLKEVYTIQETWEDQIQKFSEIDDFETLINDTVGLVENLREECENSYDNMPESLQETSESGMLLEERIYAMEEWYQAIEELYNYIEPHLDNWFNYDDKEKFEVILEVSNDFLEVIGDVNV